MTNLRPDYLGVGLSVLSGDVDVLTCYHLIQHPSCFSLIEHLSKPSFVLSYDIFTTDGHVSIPR